jgi:hypothetical protein
VSSAGQSRCRIWRVPAPHAAIPDQHLTIGSRAWEARWEAERAEARHAAAKADAAEERAAHWARRAGLADVDSPIAGGTRPGCMPPALTRLWCGWLCTVGGCARWQSVQCGDVCCRSAVRSFESARDTRSLMSQDVAQSSLSALAAVQACWRQRRIPTARASAPAHAPPTAAPVRPQQRPDTAASAAHLVDCAS